MRVKSIICHCTLVLLVASSAERVCAGDWPQILGPDRNGRAHDEELADSWPAGGPKSVWERPVGSGFAGVAVADGTALLFHRRGNEEFVEALDARTGELVWKSAAPTGYRPSIVEDDGPRCVPVIQGGRVFIYGVAGRLRCLDLKTGDELWSRATHEEFSAQEGYFGAGSTPIVEGEALLVNVGGSREKAGIVAFDVRNGKTIWAATDEQASYSSPVAATVDGARHVIFATRLSAVSVDPKNGAVRFQFPFGARGPTVNAANPVVIGDKVFLTASYGVGAVLAQIGRGGAETLWREDDLLSSQYTTPVAVGKVLYGIDGRQDLGVARLRAIDVDSRRVLWTEEGFGYATLIEADGKLVIVKTDGELVLAEANPKRFVLLARTRLFSDTTRALPALADGLLYARNGKTLKCVDLRK